MVDCDWEIECIRLNKELALARETNDRHCVERDRAYAALQDYNEEMAKICDAEAVRWGAQGCITEMTAAMWCAESIRQAA
jgi:hypothetical protein